jgi:hypothetical protein
MASIGELIDARKFSKDEDGSIAATRVFRVLQAQNEQAARVAFDALEGSNAFPGYPFVVLDRVDIQGANGNTLYIVNATYSTFRGGRRPRDPETITEIPFFGWQYAKETVEIPFAFRKTITTRTGDQEATAIVWDAKTVKVAERRVRRTLRVAYVTDQTASLDIIAIQDRKIHTIRGKDYLFLGADVQQDSKDQTRFLITYTWELDKGTTVTPTSSTIVAFPDGPLPDPGTGRQYGFICAPRDAVVNSGGSVTIRAPYTVMDLVANPDARAIPEAVLIQSYEADPDGWRTLPGMVPL